MMAAIRASQLDKKVTLLEKNPTLGKKLLLTGKGRCNLTNLCGLDDFIKRFSKNGQFLRDAFKAFFNQDLVDFFQKRNLKLKTERQLRVFPVDDRSESILEILKKELYKNKVKILYNSQAESIIVKDNRVDGVRLKDGRLTKSNSVILATGGTSYKSTGSSGDGHKMAKGLGHKLTSLKPGLIALVTKEKYPKSLEGLTLKNIRIIFGNGKKKIISEIGEMIFTDFGISGPLVLTLSGKIVDWLDAAGKVRADIDLKPALSAEQVEARLLREIEANPKKTTKNILKNMLPLRLVDVFLKISDTLPEKKVSQLTQIERKNLLSLFKTLNLTILKSRPMNLAMVTRGGISLKDINPKTMESRLVKGLYFAGEIVDVDADTGGFNLQMAFSTGYLAGQSVVS